LDGAGVVDPQFAAQTEAVAFWPVEIIASRCSAVGSSKETSFRKGFSEIAVLVNGWIATFVAPSSGEPELRTYLLDGAGKHGHGEDVLALRVEK